MHIALFRALKSITIDDERATEVVEKLEEYVAMKIKEATAELVAQQRATNWLIGTIGSIIAIGVLVSALAPIITKLGH